MVMKVYQKESRFSGRWEKIFSEPGDRPIFKRQSMPCCQIFYSCKNSKFNSWPSFELTGGKSSNWTVSEIRSSPFRRHCRRRRHRRRRRRRHRRHRRRRRHQVLMKLLSLKKGKLGCRDLAPIAKTFPCFIYTHSRNIRLAVRLRCSLSAATIGCSVIFL